jgi:hypothetical protein
MGTDRWSAQDHAAYLRKLAASKNPKRAVRPHEEPNEFRMIVDAIPETWMRGLPVHQPDHSCRIVTPDNMREAQSLIRGLIGAMNVVPMSGDLIATMTFYLPDRRRKDVDNLMKLWCDAANALVYEDDSQIVQAIIEKRFDDPEHPRTEVLIEKVKPAALPLFPEPKP